MALAAISTALLPLQNGRDLGLLHDPLAGSDDEEDTMPSRDRQPNGQETDETDENTDDDVSGGGAGKRKPLAEGYNEEDDFRLFRVISTINDEYHAKFKAVFA